MVGAEVEVGFEDGDLLGEFCDVAWAVGLREARGGDHHVFGGVGVGDELEEVGGVAGALEEEAAEGIGEHFGQFFGVSTVAEHGVEGVVGGVLRHLAAHLFVAAGGDDDEAGARCDSLEEGVVGGGIAGVEGYDDVGVCAVGVRDGSLLEAEAGVAVAGSYLVAEGDHVLAVFYPRDFGCELHVLGQVVVEGEGEVAFAGAHIGNPQHFLRGDGADEAV